ncbi:uncharacterized protein LOC111365397 [Olea europaea var. sylvestris]|uniref:uncharacterized protein LOC111365397 n=1 Tax=Olea europaea var. sylvestris TaxID=158386 RepID=UPI000C1D4125|nr:uncharacterized protein LOC111365397 [Olea europaea var. sylvestris]
MKDNIRGMGLVRKVMAKLASNSMALKGKLRAIEARLIIFYLLRDKKVLSLGSNVSQKLKNHSRQEKYLNQTNAVDSNTIVLRNSVNTSNNTKRLAKAPEEEEQEQEDKLMYPWLDDANNKEERDYSNSMDRHGKQLRLEDDVDHMADLFIQRFHQQMRLQRLNS